VCSSVVEEVEFSRNTQAFQCRCKFVQCNFSDCEAAAGGGIYCYTNATAVLEVLECVFLRCKSISSYGGGIYAPSIGSPLIQHSFFYFCRCEGTMSLGGVGITINTNANEFLVNNCSFQNNTAYDDGAGIALLYGQSGGREVSINGNVFF
jgi:hypothetical protein